MKNMDLTWLSDAGLDIGTGKEYTGGEEKYLAAVRRFYLNYEKNSEKAAAYRAAGDLENYMITVHALKSNAKMIGALDLSASFEELEMAARRGDASVIEEKHDPAMASYKTLIETLRPVADMEEARDEEEISAETAKKTAEELLAALDDFDDDLSAKLVKKLSGYPFRITQKEKLKEAAGFIDDFMYEEAADLIREIQTAIEQG